MRKPVLIFAIFAFIQSITLLPSFSDEVAELDLFSPVIQKHITAETMDEIIQHTAEQNEMPASACFRNCTFEVGAIRKLFAALPDLQSLELSTCRFCESEYQEWTTPPPLTQLNLSHSYITDFDLKILGKLEYLDVLSLEGVPITGSGLSSIPKPELLRNLSLARTALNDKTLNVLKRFKNIQYLSIEHTYCSATAFYMLGLFPDLEEVDVNKKLDPHGWFYTLIRQPSLKRLPGTDLVKLDLHSWKITDESLISLTRQLPTRTLTISGNELTDKCLVALKQMPELKELFAENCKLSGEGFGSRNPQTQKLEKLVLDENPLTNTGLSEIATLKQLRFLSLRRCIAFKTTDNFRAFENMNLTYLNLSANPITADDIKALIKLPNLQALKLDDMPIRPELFDELSQNNSIRTLTFYNSRGITRYAIEKLSLMKQLRTVHFGGSDISKKDAAYLAKQLPQLRIDLDSLYIE